MVTGDEVKVIQGGDGDLPSDEVVIDAIVYEAEGAVRISGRGLAGRWCGCTWTMRFWPKCRSRRTGAGQCCPRA
ncbi:MAG: hypothetical protein HZT43_11255 [Exiguobacterium profundum]|nr:MAG: hypothetical protein HZT43_11255 [Exiguobacterium profundum]